MYDGQVNISPHKNIIGTDKSEYFDFKNFLEKIYKLRKIIATEKQLNNKK
jgi:hypothetical protein